MTDSHLAQNPNPSFLFDTAMDDDHHHDHHDNRDDDINGMGKSFMSSHQPSRRHSNESVGGGGGNSFNRSNLNNNNDTTRRNSYSTLPNQEGTNNNNSNNRRSSNANNTNNNYNNNNYNNNNNNRKSSSLALSADVLVPNLAHRCILRDPTTRRVRFVPWGGNAAVIFADISGYSKLTSRLATEGLGATAVADAVNSYFTRVIKIVSEHGGEIVKFAGDLCVGVWVAKDNEINSHRASFQALRCASEIQRSCGTHVIYGNGEEHQQQQQNSSAGANYRKDKLNQTGSSGFSSPNALLQATTSRLNNNNNTNKGSLPGSSAVSQQPSFSGTTRSGGKNNNNNNTLVKRGGSFAALPHTASGTLKGSFRQLNTASSAIFSTTNTIENTLRRTNIDANNSNNANNYNNNANNNNNNNNQQDSVTLHLHIGVACGELHAEVLTPPTSSEGVREVLPRAFFYCSGPVLADAGDACTESPNGTICATPELLQSLGSTIREMLEWEPSANSQMHLIRDVNQPVLLGKQSGDPKKLFNCARRDQDVDDDFIPPQLLNRLSHGLTFSDAMETRDVVVLFIKKIPETTSTALWFRDVSMLLARYHCPIVQALDDDKGVHLCACLNLFVSEPNAGDLAVEMSRRVCEDVCGVAIGIARGFALCGLVGDIDSCARPDIHGEVVVRACRLMEYAASHFAYELLPFGDSQSSAIDPDNLQVGIDQSVVNQLQDKSQVRVVNKRVQIKGTTTPQSVFSFATPVSSRYHRAENGGGGQRYTSHGHRRASMNFNNNNNLGSTVLANAGTAYFGHSGIIPGSLNGNNNIDQQQFSSITNHPFGSNSNRPHGRNSSTFGNYEAFGTMQETQTMRANHSNSVLNNTNMMINNSTVANQYLSGIGEFATDASKLLASICSYNRWSYTPNCRSVERQEFRDDYILGHHHHLAHQFNQQQQSSTAILESIINDGANNNNDDDVNNNSPDDLNNLYSSQPGSGPYRLDSGGEESLFFGGLGSGSFQNSDFGPQTSAAWYQHQHQQRHSQTADSTNSNGSNNNNLHSQPSTANAYFMGQQSNPQFAPLNLDNNNNNNGPPTPSTYHHHHNNNNNNQNSNNPYTYILPPPMQLALISSCPLAGKKSLALSSCHWNGLTPIMHRATKTIQHNVLHTVSAWFCFHPSPILRMKARRCVAAFNKEGLSFVVSTLTFELMEAALALNVRVAIIVDHAEFLDEVSLLFIRTAMLHITQSEKKKDTSILPTSVRRKSMVLEGSSLLPANLGHHKRNSIAPLSPHKKEKKPQNHQEGELFSAAAFSSKQDGDTNNNHSAPKKESSGDSGSTNQNGPFSGGSSASNHPFSGNSTMTVTSSSGAKQSSPDTTTTQNYPVPPLIARRRRESIARNNNNVAVLPPALAAMSSSASAYPDANSMNSFVQNDSLSVNPLPLMVPTTPMKPGQQQSSTNSSNPRKNNFRAFASSKPEENNNDDNDESTNRRDSSSTAGGGQKTPSHIGSDITISTSSPLMTPGSQSSQYISSPTVLAHTIAIGNNNNNNKGSPSTTGGMMMYHHNNTSPTTTSNNNKLSSGNNEIPEGASANDLLIVDAILDDAKERNQKEEQEKSGSQLAARSSSFHRLPRGASLRGSLRTRATAVTPNPLSAVGLAAVAEENKNSENSSGSYLNSLNLPREHQHRASSSMGNHNNNHLKNPFETSSSGRPSRLSFCMDHENIEHPSNNNNNDRRNSTTDSGRNSAWNQVNNNTSNQNPVGRSQSILEDSLQYRATGGSRVGAQTPSPKQKSVSNTNKLNERKQWMWILCHTPVYGSVGETHLQTLVVGSFQQSVKTIKLDQLSVDEEIAVVNDYLEVGDDHVTNDSNWLIIRRLSHGLPGATIALIRFIMQMTQLAVRHLVDYYPGLFKEYVDGRFDHTSENYYLRSQQQQQQMNNTNQQYPFQNTHTTTTTSEGGDHSPNSLANFSPASLPVSMSPTNNNSNNQSQSPNSPSHSNVGGGGMMNMIMQSTGKVKRRSIDVRSDDGQHSTHNNSITSSSPLAIGSPYSSNLGTVHNNNNNNTHHHHHNQQERKTSTTSNNNNNNIRSSVSPARRASLMSEDSDLQLNRPTLTKDGGSGNKLLKKVDTASPLMSPADNNTSLMNKKENGDKVHDDDDDDHKKALALRKADGSGGKRKESFVVVQDSVDIQFYSPFKKEDINPDDDESKLISSPGRKRRSSEALVNFEETLRNSYHNSSADNDDQDEDDEFHEEEENPQVFGVDEEAPSLTREETILNWGGALRLDGHSCMTDHGFQLCKFIQWSAVSRNALSATDSMTDELSADLLIIVKVASLITKEPEDCCSVNLVAEIAARYLKVDQRSLLRKFEHLRALYFFEFEDDYARKKIENIRKLEEKEKLERERDEKKFFAPDDDNKTDNNNSSKEKFMLNNNSITRHPDNNNKKDDDDDEDEELQPQPRDEGTSTSFTVTGNEAYAKSEAAVVNDKNNNTSSSHQYRQQLRAKYSNLGHLSITFKLAPLQEQVESRILPSMKREVSLFALKRLSKKFLEERAVFEKAVIKESIAKQKREYEEEQEVIRKAKEAEAAAARRIQYPSLPDSYHQKGAAAGKSGEKNSTTSNTDEDSNNNKSNNKTLHHQHLLHNTSSSHHHQPKNTPHPSSVSLHDFLSWCFFRYLQFARLAYQMKNQKELTTNFLRRAWKIALDKDALRQDERKKEQEKRSNNNTSGATNTSNNNNSNSTSNNQTYNFRSGSLSTQTSNSLSRKKSSNSNSNSVFVRDKNSLNPSKRIGGSINFESNLSELEWDSDHIARLADKYEISLAALRDVDDSSSDEETDDEQQQDGESKSKNNNLAFAGSAGNVVKASLDPHKKKRRKKKHDSSSKLDNNNNNDHNQSSTGTFNFNSNMKISLYSLIPPSSVGLSHSNSEAEAVSGSNGENSNSNNNNQHPHHHHQQEKYDENGRPIIKTETNKTTTANEQSESSPSEQQKQQQQQPQFTVYRPRREATLKTPAFMPIRPPKSIDAHTPERFFATAVAPLPLGPLSGIINILGRDVFAKQYHMHNIQMMLDVDLSDVMKIIRSRTAFEQRRRVESDLLVSESSEVIAEAAKDAVASFGGSSSASLAFEFDTFSFGKMVERFEEYVPLEIDLENDSDDEDNSDDNDGMNSNTNKSRKSSTAHHDNDEDDNDEYEDEELKKYRMSLKMENEDAFGAFKAQDENEEVKEDPFSSTGENNKNNMISISQPQDDENINNNTQSDEQEQSQQPSAFQQQQIEELRRKQEQIQKRELEKAEYRFKHRGLLENERKAFARFFQLAFNTSAVLVTVSETNDPEIFKLMSSTLEKISTHDEEQQQKASSVMENNNNKTSNSETTTTPEKKIGDESASSTKKKSPVAVIVEEEENGEDQNQNQQLPNKAAAKKQLLTAKIEEDDYRTALTTELVVNIARLCTGDFRKYNGELNQVRCKRIERYMRKTYQAPPDLRSARVKNHEKFARQYDLLYRVYELIKYCCLSEETRNNVEMGLYANGATEGLMDESNAVRAAFVVLAVEDFAFPYPYQNTAVLRDLWFSGELRTVEFKAFLYCSLLFFDIVWESSFGDSTPIMMNDNSNTG